MKSESKIRNRILSVIAGVICIGSTAVEDTVTVMFSRHVEWRIGAEATSAGVLGTNSYLRGENSQGKRIRYTFGGAIRTDFSFNPATREEYSKDFCHQESLHKYWIPAW